MASVKEHLSSFHARAAAHHLARAKFHKAMSGHFHKLAAFHKAEMDDAGAMDLFDSAADEHNQMADECISMGEYHTDCAKALNDGEPAAKAAGLSNSRTASIVGDRVSAVVPEAPSSVRAVPRYGQREISAPEVAPEFEKLVSTEDDTVLQ